MAVIELNFSDYLERYNEEDVIKNPDLKYISWKHCIIPQEISLIENHLSVVIFKNPYSWLISTWLKPYHNKQEDKFEDFLYNKWPTFEFENYNQTYFNNPIELWNIKNNSYLDILPNISSKGTIYLRYEDLIRETELIIRNKFNQFKVLKFKNYEERTLDNSRNLNFARDFYLNDKWRIYYKNKLEIINYINSNLDKELMSRLKYNYL